MSRATAFHQLLITALCVLAPIAREFASQVSAMTAFSSAPRSRGALRCARYCPETSCPSMARVPAFGPLQLTERSTWPAVWQELSRVGVDVLNVCTLWGAFEGNLGFLKIL